MSRVERLFDLIALLLKSGRPFTAEQIREMVPGYDQPNQASFRKMFERDKAALRELGVPIALIPVPGEADGVEGYTIRPDEYRLEDPCLLPDERAALGLALRAVRLESGAVAEDDPRYAGLKLSLPGYDATELPPVIAAVDVADGRVAILLGAVAERAAVTFEYTTAAGEFGSRSLEPAALGNVGGHWYVAGHDLDRDGRRLFRLDRIAGEVVVGEPGAFEVGERPDIPALLSAGPWAIGGKNVEVEIRFDGGEAWRARNLFGNSATFHDHGDSVTAVLDAAEPELLIDSLLPFRTTAEIIRPESLRRRMIEHLAGMLP